MAITSVPKTERLQAARAHALKEAIARCNNELMDAEERMVLLDRSNAVNQQRTESVPPVASGMTVVFALLFVV